ncbi:MAG: glycoside hydrolase family 2 protein [Thermomicrobiales bacterium]
MVPPLSPEHPRPQLQRAGWSNLDGAWEFAFDREGMLSRPEQVAFDRVIRVPFAPETPLSGIADEAFTLAVWYRRVFDAPDLADGERLMLRFGAVDDEASIWVDGAFAGSHRGGYTPFGFDITDLLAGSGPHEIVVRAGDDPHDLAKPRGKQDWKREPHAIWYPRTTGIWQTVWLERVPRNHIESLRWTANTERWEIELEAAIGGPRRDDLALDVLLTTGEGAERRVLAHDRYAVIAREVHRRIAFPDPGIDNARSDLLWSPNSPRLIDAAVRLIDAGGAAVDEVASYTAMRSVGILGDRFMLNGRPIYLRLALDQGYWPDGGLTAPSVDALRRDVELAKEMGLNGVRKHQKIEDPRYLYWADRLGLLVWEEMPSAYRFSRNAMERVSAEWTRAVLRDMSHPCVVTWVPINESWGVPELPKSAEQQAYIQGLYHLTRALDPSRPVVGNDGWEIAESDIVCLHDYHPDPEKLTERYGDIAHMNEVFARERPLGRVLLLDGHPYRGQPVLLSEFGGIAYTPPSEQSQTWGYSRAGSSEGFLEAFSAMLAAVRGCGMLAGYCYTQFTDTYQEANGILAADRTPKAPLAEIARAFIGAGPDRNCL